ncbi:MAG: transposase [Bacteroidales bacterium]|nr:transposase [Bacteroidales bacterium]
MSFVSVNAWVKRYKEEGIDGLKTRVRRGRKPIMDSSDEDAYEYKVEKLQELEVQASDGRIALYYADDSHTCTEGYVPYGWQLEEIVSFLDEFSFRIRKNTFVVFDNATVHRNRWIKGLRSIWEKRELFIFFLPPYSPHLNIAETLWRILKGKWIRLCPNKKLAISRRCRRVEIRQNCPRRNLPNQSQKLSRKVAKFLQNADFARHQLRQGDTRRPRMDRVQR